MNLPGYQYEKLTGSQYKQLTNILVEAFPDPDELEMMVKFRLGKNLKAIALADNLEKIVFKLIGHFESRDLTPQLIIAARQSKPTNSNLFAFAQQYNLAIQTLSRAELEKTIRTTNSFLDINLWREKLGEIEGQICRIEIAVDEGYICGTGFLVGESAIITNYHVMEAVILGEQGLTDRNGHKALPKDVTLRFDYKKIADGTVINEGTEYYLPEKDWLIDCSPYAGTQATDQIDRLDYALLKINGSPGKEPIGKKAEPGAPKRGWIEIPSEPYRFQPNTPLIIVQHPEANPLKLAIDTEAIIKLSEDETTVYYNTNTEGGSSGSPCFNQNWELVALHHSGDPNFNPTYNAGTPISKIIELLEKRGIKNVLGEQLL